MVCAVSGWIKLDKDMLDDPRLISAASRLASRYVMAAKTSSQGARDLSRADELRFACNALRGALVTLWIYADTHIRDDDTLAIGGLQAINALVGIEDFCALLPADWIRELDDGSVELPGYCEKNSLIAKRKRAADAAVRVRRYREKKRSGSGVHNAERTTARNPPQGNNVTRNNVVTKSVDLDQDQDLDQIRQDTQERARVQPITYQLPSEFAAWLDGIYPATSHSRNVIDGYHRAQGLIGRGLLTESDLRRRLAGFRAYVDSGGYSGPHHVPSLRNWLDSNHPERYWSREWSAVPTAGEKREDKNLAAVQEFLDADRASA